MTQDVEKGRARIGAGAPADKNETGYGYFPPSEVSRESEPKPDPIRQALEAAFMDWYGSNYNILDVGLPGDVYDLRDKLNAAFANVSIWSCDAPKTE